VRLGDDEGELLLLEKTEERFTADNVGRSRVSKPLVSRVTCVGVGHSESLDGDLGAFLESNFNPGHVDFSLRKLRNLLFGCGPETDLDLARELDFEPSGLSWNQRARLEVN
jgi:hypothetical protein